MADLATNVTARADAAALVEAAGEQPQRFWEVLAELAQEKLPKPEPVKEKHPAMTDDEAREFEEQIIPYGKYRGVAVWHAEPDYLLFLTEGDEFSRELRRYVKSKRFQARQDDDT